MVLDRSYWVVKVPDVALTVTPNAPSSMPVCVDATMSAESQFPPAAETMFSVTPEGLERVKLCFSTPVGVLSLQRARRALRPGVFRGAEAWLPRAA